MNLLCIDIGTQTGWAISTRNGIRSGTHSFSPRKGEGPGQRWLKFRAFLNQTANGQDLHAIYYEDVKRHVGVLAAHAYGGFLAVLQMWCDMNCVQLIPVGVGTIKKSWTGKGNADKDLMIATAKAKGFHPVDSNEADALALLDYARKDQCIITKIEKEKP